MGKLPFLSHAKSRISKAMTRTLMERRDSFSRYYQTKVASEIFRIWVQDVFDKTFKIRAL
jgi:hypothetical protein